MGRVGTAHHLGLTRPILVSNAYPTSFKDGHCEDCSLGRGNLVLNNFTAEFAAAAITPSQRPLENYAALLAALARYRSKSSEPPM